MDWKLKQSNIKKWKCKIMKNAFACSFNIRLCLKCENNVKNKLKWKHFCRMLKKRKIWKMKKLSLLPYCTLFFKKLSPIAAIVRWKNFLNVSKIKKVLVWLVAGVGFEPTAFRLWAWRATRLLHPAINLLFLYYILIF